MRMTRAALRAQEAEDELKKNVDAQIDEQQSLAPHNDSSGECLIHEDSDKENSFAGGTSAGVEDEDDAGERPALRDITEENYPTSLNPENENGEQKIALEVVETPTPTPSESQNKTQKKAKSKRGKKGGKKKGEQTEEQSVEQQSETAMDDMTNSMSGVALEDSLQTTAVDLSPDGSQASSQPVVETESLSEEEGIREPRSTVESDQMNAGSDSDQAEKLAHDKISAQPEADLSSQTGPTTPSKQAAIASKTPKFNPEVHLPPREVSSPPANEIEDSFVVSIKTRSPSKLSQSQSIFDCQDQEENNSFTENMLRRTPSKALSRVSSTSPQRIEDSVEAMDALEDAIEKFAEDLPVLETLPFESPIRSRKVLERTPAKPAARTPARTPAKTPAKTPALRASLRPSPTKVGTPSADKKVDIKTSQPLRERMASTKKDLVKERTKSADTKPSPSAHRRATSAYVSKKDTMEPKAAVRPKHNATKSVSSIPPNVSTASSSGAPVKTAVNDPKKRVTSSGTLVTSKPAFVPARSTKPLTKSTFTLPGEAIAARLKTQREERSKKEEAEAERKSTFKARPAPSKTARPSVMPRENKASSVRLHARQASSENKENVAPQRSTSTAGPTTQAGTSSRPKSFVSTASSDTTGAGVRRTTIAPRPTSLIESRKSTHAPSALPAQTSQRVTSLTSGQPSAVSKTDAAQQRLKGKEVYARIRGSVQQQEEEKKAKEEAARKARAEAAEKGRQASREWAEKQKQKMMNAKTNAAGSGLAEKRTVTAATAEIGS